MVFQSVVGMQSLCQGCEGNFAGCRTSVRLLAHVPYNFVFPFICMTGTSFFLSASFCFSIPDRLFFYPKADLCLKSLPLQPHLSPTITPPFISIPTTIIPLHHSRYESETHRREPRLTKQVNIVFDAGIAVQAEPLLSHSNNPYSQDPPYSGCMPTSRCRGTVSCIFITSVVWHPTFN